MGTRGLTMVVVDGEIQVAQYGQWDHYPSGQGRTACAFIREYAFSRTTVDGHSCVVYAPEKLDKFRDAVKRVHKLTDSDLDALYQGVLGDGTKNEWITYEDSQKMKVALPQIHRDMGAQILLWIWNNMEHPDFGLPIKGVTLSSSFAADSLFCEWAYVLDLDRNVLEIYKGGQETPPSSGRFKDFPVQADRHKTFYPVDLLVEIPFSQVTDKSPVPEVDAAMRADAKYKDYFDDEEEGAEQSPWREG